MPPHYGHLVRLLHSCTDQNVTAALSSMELTNAQGHILGFLALSPQPPCPRDIEAAFHLSHPTVSGLLSRLEKKGFIAFRPDETDRRSKRIYILPKGSACNERMYHIIMENEAQMVSGFTEAEKSQFTDLLTRAVRNMGAQPYPKKQKEEINP